MNYVRPNNISLKYKRFTPSGGKDIEIGKFRFAAKIRKRGCSAPNASLADHESG